MYAKVSLSPRKMYAVLSVPVPSDPVIRIIVSTGAKKLKKRRHLNDFDRYATRVESNSGGSLACGINLGF